MDLVHPYTHHDDSDDLDDRIGCVGHEVLHKLDLMGKSFVKRDDTAPCKEPVGVGVYKFDSIFSGDRLDKIAMLRLCFFELLMCHLRQRKLHKEVESNKDDPTDERDVCQNRIDDVDNHYGDKEKRQVKQLNEGSGGEELLDLCKLTKEVRFRTCKQGIVA